MANIFKREEISEQDLSVTGTEPTAYPGDKAVTDGKSSANLDGVGSFYQASSPIKLYGWSNFTISFWIKSPYLQHTTNYCFFRYSDPSNVNTAGWQFWKYQDNFEFLGSSGFLNQVPDSYFSTTDWNHVAIVRQGTSWWIFVNGTARVTRTGYDYSFNSATRNLYIGYHNRDNVHFNGLMDDIWITNTAVWTTNFTPPTTKLVELGSEHKFVAYFDDISYKIIGTTTEDCRIIVLNENDWSVEYSGLHEAGDYEIALTEGYKTALAIPTASGTTFPPIAYNTVYTTAI